jgi:hypothetical protein
MKLTKSTLKQIIKEELDASLQNEAAGPSPEQQKVMNMINQAAGLMEDAWYAAKNDPDLLKHINSMANEIHRQFGSRS